MGGKCCCKLLKFALEMWSDVKQYVATVKQGKVQIPKNKSFSVVAASCGDA